VSFVVTVPLDRAAAVGVEVVEAAGEESVMLEIAKLK